MPNKMKEQDLYMHCGLRSDKRLKEFCAWSKIFCHFSISSVMCNFFQPTLEPRYNELVMRLPTGSINMAMISL